jgi:hypothetical protein
LQEGARLHGRLMEGPMQSNTVPYCTAVYYALLASGPIKASSNPLSI